MTGLHTGTEKTNQIITNSIMACLAVQICYLN